MKFFDEFFDIETYDSIKYIFDTKQTRTLAEITS